MTQAVPGPRRPATARSTSAPTALPSGGSLLHRALPFLARLESPVTTYYVLLGTTAILVVIGLVMVLSASMITSYRADGSTFTRLPRPGQVRRHRRGRRGGRLPAPGALVQPARAARPCSAPWCCRPLVFTQLGVSVNGNRNWVKLLPGVQLQPSELVKLALILVGAAVLTKKRKLLGRLRHVVVPFLVPIVLVTVGLVLVGHDLGTALILIGIVGALLFVSGVPARFFLLAAGMFAVIGHGLRRHQPEPDGPHHLLARQLRQRRRHLLPVGPRAVRARRRRLVGRRSRREQGEVELAPRGPQRLHLRHHRRGARPARHLRHPPAVHAAGLGLLPARPALARPVRAGRDRRGHGLDPHAGHHQHRRRHRAAAGHRRPPAARVGRRLRPGDHPAGPRHAAVLRPQRARRRGRSSPPGPARSGARWPCCRAAGSADGPVRRTLVGAPGRRRHGRSRLAPARPRRRPAAPRPGGEGHRPRHRGRPRGPARAGARLRPALRAPGAPAPPPRPRPARPARRAAGSGRGGRPGHRRDRRRGRRRLRRLRLGPGLPRRPPAPHTRRRPRAERHGPASPTGSAPASPGSSRRPSPARPCARAGCSACRCAARSRSSTGRPGATRRWPPSGSTRSGPPSSSRAGRSGAQRLNTTFAVAGRRAERGRAPGAARHRGAARSSSPDLPAVGRALRRRALRRPHGARLRRRRPRRLPLRGQHRLRAHRRGPACGLRAAADRQRRAAAQRRRRSWPPAAASSSTTRCSPPSGSPTTCCPWRPTGRGWTPWPTRPPPWGSATPTTPSRASSTRRTPRSAPCGRSGR